jgi:hypothetical protein
MTRDQTTRDQTS